jgi:hypothetical protein
MGDKEQMDLEDQEVIRVHSCSSWLILFSGG